VSNFHLSLLSKVLLFIHFPIAVEASINFSLTLTYISTP
jgi:hypothetical protein